VTTEISSELCYFLGLITGRGRIYESNSNKRIIIEIPHKNQNQTGVPFCPLCSVGVVTNSKCKSCKKNTLPQYRVKVEQRKEVLKTVTTVLSPLISDLVGIKPEISGSDVYTYLSINFSENSELFELIKGMFKPYTSFLSFEIPDTIKTISKEFKLEYLAGVADTAGFPIWGNWHSSGLTRMYLQIPNSNWKLPVQLCNFLQDHLNIPVQTIDWGHPNIRDGNMIEFTEGKLFSAFREHQLKIFSDHFDLVPIKFTHKKKLLSELISYNKTLSINSSTFCTPPNPIPDRRVKVIHGAENSDKLPTELKGKHFDAFWQVCWTMGCNRCDVFKLKDNNDAIFISGKDRPSSFSSENNRLGEVRKRTTIRMNSTWNEIKSRIGRRSSKTAKSSSLSEADTYEPQQEWLQKYLEEKYPESRIDTFVVADSDMSSFFSRSGNDTHTELVNEYDIRPDVVGIIDGKKIVFIESKITLLGIKEIGQLLGYCLVAEPEIAILCSTKDSSGKLTTILPHKELLEFNGNKKILCANWDQENKTMTFLGNDDG